MGAGDCVGANQRRARRFVGRRGKKNWVVYVKLVLQHTCNRATATLGMWHMIFCIEIKIRALNNPSCMS